MSAVILFCLMGLLVFVMVIRESKDDNNKNNDNNSNDNEKPKTSPERLGTIGGGMTG